MPGPDPKPRGRVRLSRIAYAALCWEIREVQHGRCACGCGRRIESFHHLIGGANRSDVPENLVGLAGDGTRLCHGALTSGCRAWDPIRDEYVDPERVAAGIRHHLETVRLDAREYIVQVKSEAWLNLRYPIA